MPRITPALAFAALTLAAGLAFAEPRFVLRYPGGVPQVSITGDFSQTTYTVSRAPASGGGFIPITENSVLCMGSCYADDRGAVPGVSYLYRFDVRLADGSPATFGPFLATISPALARPLGLYVFPNPGRGATGIQLHVAGAPTEPAVQGEVMVHDLAGRRVRTIERGAIARGLTTVTWDGRDDHGAELKPGVYVVRFTTAGGAAIARLIRR
ncbi:MAG TPA: FlgD immunoglobulin-like domain containing protein [Candidatus Eisenbacteria bacterium]|nr:FlgD immunoglobulin-like domain containing protein [Candidatus Eisenbacteria bacterium]